MRNPRPFVTSRHRDTNTVSSQPHDATGSRPLPDRERIRLETQLGHSLEHVRVHADSASHDLATSLGARAFALGDDLYFRAGQYAPETVAGFELLVHETIHVLQHGDSLTSEAEPRVSQQTDADEVTAEAATRSVMQGDATSVTAAAAGPPVIARWPWDDSGGGSIFDTISNVGSSALALGNDAGKWMHDAQSSVVNEVLNHPAEVAKSAAAVNNDWGNLVDAGERGVSSLTESAVDATSDIPLLGSIVESAAFFTDVSAQSLGGTAKGLGDLVTAGTTAAANPLAPVQGLLSMAEHTPGFAGTALKGAHGLFDIATGNEKGEYGKDVGELWGNLTDADTQSEQDLKFWAGLGGGVEAWEDKPVEAGMRTLANLAPMLLGEFIGEPVGPRVIEPTEFGPPKGSAAGGGRPLGPGPELPPSSEGPPGTRPYGPEFFEPPPETKPYGQDFFNPEGPPTERGMDTLRGVAEPANPPVEVPAPPIEEPAVPGKKTPVGQGSDGIAMEELDHELARRLRQRQGYTTREEVQHYLRRNPPNFPPAPAPFKK
jgi:hypothetical protein